MRPALRRSGGADQSSTRPGDRGAGERLARAGRGASVPAVAVLVAAQLAIAGHALWSAGIAARAGARAALVGGARRGRRARGAAAAAAQGRPGRRRRAGSRSGCRCRACFPACRRFGSSARTDAGAAPVSGVRERGQATVELVAALPALLLAGYVAFQLLAAGYALTPRRRRRRGGRAGAGRGQAGGEGDPRGAARLGGGRGRGQRPRRPGDGAPAAAVARARRSPSASRSPAVGRGEAAMSSERAAIAASAGSGEAEGSRAAAAALACAASERRPRGAARRAHATARPPRPALVASAAARALEERLAAHLPEAGVAARGALCHLALRPGREGLGARRRRPWRWSATRLGVVHLRPACCRPRSRSRGLRAGAALLRADLGRRPGADRARGPRPARPRARRSRWRSGRCAWVPARRALFGALPAGAAGGAAAGAAC